MANRWGAECSELIFSKLKAEVDFKMERPVNKLFRLKH
jgi:hypothetical protein